MIPFIRNRCVINVPRECVSLFTNIKPIGDDGGVCYVIARAEYVSWKYG